MQRYKILIPILMLFSNIGFSSSNINFSYEDLINTMLLTHPDIRNSQYNIDLAEDDELRALYARLPSISFSLSGFPISPYLYNDYNGMVADWKQWKPAAQIYSVLYIPIYDFGKSGNLQDAAHYKTAATKLQAKITEQNIIFSAKQLYWGYLLYNSYKKYIFDLVLPEFEKTMNNKDKEFTKGKISRSSAENARIDYLNMKKNFLGLEHKKQQLDSQLRLLYKISSDEDVSINFKVKYIYPVNVEIQPYSFYLSMARKNNPRVQQAEKMYLATKSYSASEHASIWPDIGFALSASYTYLDFKRAQDLYTNVYPDGGLKFAFGFRLNWDFNIWQKINNYDIAEKKLQKQEEEMKYAIAQMEQQLRNSYNDLVYQKSILDYQEEILSIARRNFIFTNRAYSLGTVTADNVTATLKTLYTNLDNYYNQIQKYNVSLSTFENLIGKNIADYKTKEQEEVENEVLLNSNNEDA